MLVAFFVWAPYAGAQHEAPAIPSRSPEPIEASVQFLGGQNARDAIVDESMEPYFKRMQPMEMSAKTGSPMTGETLEQQRGECRRRYAAAVREFTEDEKDALRWLVTKIVPQLGGKYPVLARTPWIFIKVAPSLEGGLPHTRGGCIVLSDLTLGPLVQRRTIDPEWLTLTRSGELLLHEQTHVIQREHPDLFTDLYTRFWGFRHAARIQGCDWLTTHQLLDPDGVDTHWVFPLKSGGQIRWILPLTVLPDAGARLGQMRKVAVDVEPAEGDAFRVKVDPSGMPYMQDLASLSDYTHRFLPAHSVYHPNEIAADLFARMVLAEQVLPGSAPPEADAALAKAKTIFHPLEEQFERIMAVSARQ